MARHHSPRHRLLPLALTTVLLAGAWAAPAHAASPAEDVTAAEARLAVLVADESAVAVRAQEATAAVGEAEAQLVGVSAEAAAAQARVSSARSESGRLASAAYRQGGVITGALHLLLSDDREGVEVDTAYLRARLEGQIAERGRTEALGADLEAQQAALAAQVQQRRADRDAVTAQRAAVAGAVAVAGRELDGLRVAARAAAEAAARVAQAASASRSVARAAQTAAAAEAPAAATGRSAPAAAPAPQASSGSCAPSGSRGAETRLTPATLSIMRCGLAAFPQLEFAGGWGNRGNATDHDDGRAVDFMIPGYRTAEGRALGWAVARWAAAQPGVDYVMFDRQMKGSWGSGAWTSVGDRGSDTANHLDHVHVSIKR